MDINTIFENNEKWIRQKLDKDPDYFAELAKGQRPPVLYIGCSDSRVTAEELMGMAPGELFVHRNIANMIPQLDMSVTSVINYAVDYLLVDHLVVCGHYYCGGVKAAMSGDDLAILNPWLSGIKDVYRLHQEELEGIADEEARYRRLVELNVQEQCINAIKLPDVQKARAKRGLKVHGWVFDMATGRLIDLKIDFDAVLQKIHGIYAINY